MTTLTTLRNDCKALRDHYRSYATLARGFDGRPSQQLEEIHTLLCVAYVALREAVDWQRPFFVQPSASCRRESRREI